MRCLLRSEVEVDELLVARRSIMLNRPAGWQPDTFHRDIDMSVKPKCSAVPLSLDEYEPLACFVPGVCCRRNGTPLRQQCPE